MQQNAWQEHEKRQRKLDSIPSLLIAVLLVIGAVFFLLTL
jgi:hypothetical protein